MREERLQRGGQRRCGEGGATEGSVRPLCGRRGASNDGQAHARPEAGDDRAAAVEERRALGSGQADDANDIALGAAVGRE